MSRDFIPGLRDETSRDFIPGLRDETSRDSLEKVGDVSRLRGKYPGTSRDVCETFQCTDKVL